MRTIDWPNRGGSRTGTAGAAQARRRRRAAGTAPANGLGQGRLGALLSAQRCFQDVAKLGVPSTGRGGRRARSSSFSAGSTLRMVSVVIQVSESMPLSVPTLCCNTCYECKGELTWRRGHGGGAVSRFLEAFQWHGVKRGDAFGFYAGDIRVEGPHPFCSSGGNLGTGRLRTAMYTDSIEQLRGTAGPRQVKDSRRHRAGGLHHAKQRRLDHVRQTPELTVLRHWSETLTLGRPRIPHSGVRVRGAWGRLCANSRPSSLPVPGECIIFHRLSIGPAPTRVSQYETASTYLNFALQCSRHAARRLNPRRR